MTTNQEPDAPTAVETESSDAETEGEPQVVDEFSSTENGISTEKTITCHDEFSKVRFEIRSTRDERTQIVLIEPLPPEITNEHIGFHSDYYGECWTLEGEARLLFEREFAPGEEIVTSYGIKTSDLDELEGCRQEPVIYVDSAIESEAGSVADVTPAVGDDATGQVVETDGGAASGGRDTPPKLELDEDALAESGFEANGSPEAEVDADGSSDAEEGEPSGDTEAGEEEPEDVQSPATTEHEPASETDGLLAALVQELEDRELSERQRQVLREAIAPEQRRSREVRLEHVQQRIDDLMAYRDALEAFIDERGSAPDVIESFEEDVADLRERLDDVEELRAELDDLERSVNDFETEFESVHSRIEGLRTIESTVEELEQEVDALRDEMTATDERRTEELDRLDDRIDTLEESTASDAESIRSDLDALEAEIESLRSTVEEGAEWRARVSDSFPTVSK